MEAEKTKKARKPRKQPKVHVEVVGSWKDRPAYEQFQHWKPHIENMYHMLGYGDVTVEPSQEMIDEYNAIQANKEKGALCSEDRTSSQADKGCPRIIRKIVRLSLRVLILLRTVPVCL